MKTMTLALAGLVLLASTGMAEERSWNLRDVTAIVEPQSSVGRVLFRADLDVPEEHVAIRRAVVRVPIGSVEVSRDMTLRIHPVTAQWARGAVGWTNGWSRAGGDFEDLVHGRAELVRARGQDELRFDITVLAKEILEHGVPNRGFILTIDPRQGLGLPGEDLTRLGVLSGATLEIQYRAVPPPPRAARSS